MKREDLLDLNDVLQNPGRQLAVDITTELPDESDIDLVQPVEGFLEAVSTGNALLLTGKFTAKAVVECARCDGPLEIDLEFDVDEQFGVQGVPSSMNPQDMARVVPDEPYEMFEGNALMVENLLRQALLLAYPVQPLCEYGWDGDCPKAKDSAVRKPAASRPEFELLANLIHADEEPGSKQERGR